MNQLNIQYGEQGYSRLNQLIQASSPSVIFVITDTHTLEHCYPRFMAQIETTSRVEVIEIEPGEQHKNVETCSGVWAALNELGCDRSSLVINLGGGVITDLGGFVACTIKRGISFVQVPTSLLGMVDAAIGGKNGVDLGHQKNQIGTIVIPEMVLIDYTFLQTLSHEHLVNGSVEMFKHGLIADRDYWDRMLNMTDFYSLEFNRMIQESIQIKTRIVEVDPKEKNERKFLNYGHTVGHAIESFLLESTEKRSLLHGLAVAMGMVVESKLSVGELHFRESDYHEIKSWYQSLKIDHDLKPQDFEEVYSRMRHDKKNINGEIRFVLLREMGQPIVNQVCEKNDVELAFQELFA